MQKKKSVLNSPIQVVLAAAAVFTSAGAFAQEATFNNFLLRSPSIVSPSQNYQVKQGRFEGYLGSVNGTIDPKTEGVGDIDVNGFEAGVGAQYAVSPMAVIGVEVDYLNTDADDADSTATEISPTVAFTLTPMFSLGLGAHLVSGSEDIPGGGNSDTSFNYFTVGATLHQDLWEATLVFNTENKDDNKPQNNSAQSFGLHGRYRLNPALALGLSFFQRDTSSLAPSAVKAEDETALGFHLESRFTEQVSAEFAFITTTDTDGASGDDQSEFVAMGQYLLNPGMEIGARLSYLTSSGSAADVTAIRPGVFLTSYF